MQTMMTNDETMKSREYTVVMRGPSAVVFWQNENLLVEKFPSEAGPVNVLYTSRWIKRSETVIVPGHLWIDIRGQGNSLEKLLVPYANAGLAFLPVLALSANTAIGEPEIEVAFDSTSNVSEREYFQNYVPPESSVLHFVRHIDVNSTVALVNAINRNPEVIV